MWHQGGMSTFFAAQQLEIVKSSNYIIFGLTKTTKRFLNCRGHPPLPFERFNPAEADCGQVRTLALQG